VNILSVQLNFVHEFMHEYTRKNLISDEKNTDFQKLIGWLKLHLQATWWRKKTDFQKLSLRGESAAVLMKPGWTNFPSKIPGSFNFDMKLHWLCNG
jgi:hypothetical protein